MNNIVTRLVTVDEYWIDNWIYYNRTLKYNTTESLRTPSVFQLTTEYINNSAAIITAATLVTGELQVPFLGYQLIQPPTQTLQQLLLRRLLQTPQLDSNWAHN
jgi:hypothetical protein